MSRTLFTVSFVADCDVDTTALVIDRMEHQWALNMLHVLEVHGLELSDLADEFEFYGITAAPIRESV